MKKILSVLILLCLISTQAMAELKLGDRAAIENCRVFVSLRAEPSTSAERLEELKLKSTVNVLGAAENGFMQVETDGKIGYVLDDYLELFDDYENYAGETLDLTDEQRYNINLFLSNFSEQRMPVYDESDARTLWNARLDGFLLEFAIQHLFFNREDKFEVGDFPMGELRVKVDELSDAAWKYFKMRPTDQAWLPYQYDNGYYYMNLEDQRINGGFVSANRVEPLGDSRYAVRFCIYDGDCGCWERDACRLTPGEAAMQYDRSAEGLAVIVVDGDGTMGNLDDRSTWRLERWVTLSDVA